MKNYGLAGISFRERIENIINLKKIDQKTLEKKVKNYNFVLSIKAKNIF